MRRALLLLVVLMVLSTVTVIGMSQHYAAREREAQAEAARVHTLVKIGDELDDAIDVLRHNGFRVSEKYQPTGSGYWQVHVPLRDRIPIPAILSYTIQFPLPYSDPTMAVTIDSDLDGLVKAVDTR